MKNKILIWIIVMVLLVSSISAYIDCTPSCPAGYTKSTVNCAGLECSAICTRGAGCTGDWVYIGYDEDSSNDGYDDRLIGVDVVFDPEEENQYCSGEACYTDFCYKIKLEISAGINPGGSHPDKTEICVESEVDEDNTEFGNYWDVIDDCDDYDSWSDSWGVSEIIDTENVYIYPYNYGTTSDDQGYFDRKSGSETFDGTIDFEDDYYSIFGKQRGEFYKKEWVTADSFTSTCDRKECTSGQCCDANDMFRDSTYICNPNILEEYNCQSEDVWGKSQNQYCSGTSSSCNGRTEWESWTLKDDCTSDEYCVDGQSSCTSCGTHTTYTCYDNDVYWYDDCNNLEDKKEECYANSCGLWGMNYCKGDDIYHNRTCNSGGCSGNSCTSAPSVEEELVQTCSYGCSSSSCIVPECTKDSDCASNEMCVSLNCELQKISDLAMSIDAYPIWDYSGSFVGTETINFTSELNQALTNCVADANGDCTIPLTLISATKGTAVLDNLYIEFKEITDPCAGITCNDYCSGFTSYYNGVCSNGTCSYSMDNNSTSCGWITPVCYSNSDCGTDGFIGSEYCSGDIVLDKFRTYTCSNGGSQNATCSYTDSTQVVESCSYGCVNGSCLGTPACFVDADCGTDEYVGNSVCNGIDEVWQDYREHTCSDAGTQNAACSSTDTNKMIEDCEFGCSSGDCNPDPCANITCDSYCNGLDYYYGGTCSLGSCSYTEELNSTSCGWHVPVCYSNSDCGVNGYVGNATCNGITELWQDYRNYSCLNPGSQEANCSYVDVKQLKQNCGFCMEGVCEADARESNVKLLFFTTKDGKKIFEKEDEVQFEITIINDGDEDIKDLEWRLNTGNRVLSGTVSLLEKGKSQTISRKLDYSISGDYTAKATLDIFDIIPEFDEWDNEREFNITILSDNETDVEALLFGVKEDFKVGETGRIEMTMRNRGDNDLTDIEWELDTGKEILTDVVSLDAGKSITIIKNIIYRTNGDYDLKFTVDPDDKIVESNEANNIKELSLDVLSPNGQIIGGVGTDTDLQALFLSGKNIGGNLVLLQFTIINKGTVGVDNIEWVIDTGSGTELDGTLNLDANRGATIMRKVVYNSGTGVYNVRAVVDPDDNIIEIDETNNAKQTEVSIGGN